MIEVEFSGGLGNQMFQYAFGLWLSKQRNENVVWNLSYYDTELKYRLKFFKNCLFGKREVFVRDYRFFELLKFNLSKISLVKTKNNHKNIFVNNDFSEDNLLETINSNANYFKGCWSCYKVCDDREFLLKEFTLKDGNLPNQKITNQIKSTKNSVAIHFRRGDFFSADSMKTPFSVNLSNYYEKAVDFLKSKISKPYFFVFSDDIAWSKKYWHWSDDVFFVSDGCLKSFQEMYLMSLCEHQIMANSTFSWWGAWLNKNENKTVISPNKWFIDELSVPKGWLPNDWICL